MLIALATLRSCAVSQSNNGSNGTVFFAVCVGNLGGSPALQSKKFSRMKLLAAMIALLAMLQLVAAQHYHGECWQCGKERCCS